MTPPAKAAPRKRDYFRMLTILFLVWHGMLSLVLMTVSVLSLLGSLGVSQLVQFSPPAIPIGPIMVDRIVIAIIFVILCGLVVSWGFLLGLYSLRVSKRPSCARRATLLASILLALCVVGLVLYLSQRDLVMVLVFSYSSLLTLGLYVYLRKVSSAVDSGAVDPDKPIPGITSLDDLEALQPVHQDLTADLRGLRGFATIILVYGVLKVLMGLMLLFERPSAEAFGYDLLSFAGSSYGLGLALVLGGIFFVVCGGLSIALTRPAITSKAYLRVFLVGIGLSCLWLVVCILSFAVGVASDGLGVFTATLDIMVTMSVFWYSSRVVSAKTSDTHRGASGDVASRLPSNQ